MAKARKARKASALKNLKGKKKQVGKLEADSVRGGDNKTINAITFGVQKDKMQSANKNAEATRALL